MNNQNRRFPSLSTNPATARSQLPRLLRTIALATVAFGSGWSAHATAASSANAQSPLGINLTSVNGGTSEIPFLNIFKSAGGWITHSSSVWDTGEESYLNLDADGWPKTLSALNNPKSQQFTSVGTLLFRGLPSTPSGNYPAGQYVVLYDGEGTIIYAFDATKNVALSKPGRDILDVTPSYGGGINLTITSTDPNHTGNYIRNIRVVQASGEAAVSAGQVFNPNLLNRLQSFRTLRFMDWLETNNSTLTSWTARPVPSNAFWGSASGVPIETAIQLANAVAADAWLNVPHMADNNYITQMATLVHKQLGNGQKVYIEYSNETWNYGFGQASWIQEQGQTEWPGATVTSFELNRNWFGQRVAQMCDIWKSVWGTDANRVICVLGSQAANTFTATDALNCPLWTGGAPCVNHGIGAVAVAPYFGGPVPRNWTSQSDGGLSNLFASLRAQNDPSIPSGGWLNQASSWESAYKAALTSYKLPMIAYEGGQTFRSFPNGVNPDGSNNSLTNLYIAANRDARMGSAYTSYLQSWKANGGELFVLFADMGAYTQYGEWGLLESLMQATSPLSAAPPKWQAVQNFVAANACWWSGCGSESVQAEAIPMPPANFHAH